MDNGTDGGIKISIRGRPKPETEETFLGKLSPKYSEDHFEKNKRKSFIYQTPTHHGKLSH